MSCTCIVEIFPRIPTPLCVQLPAVHLLTWCIHREDQSLPGEGEQTADGETGSSAGSPDQLLTGPCPRSTADWGDDKEPSAGREGSNVSHVVEQFVETGETSMIWKEVTVTVTFLLLSGRQKCGGAAADGSERKHSPAEERGAASSSWELYSWEGQEETSYSVKKSGTASLWLSMFMLAVEMTPFIQLAPAV